jgi:CheY-like chemotaxis protein
VRSRILALLEEDVNSRQVVESLERSGHLVTTCKTFTEAITILEREHFDLVISDVHLENGGSVFDFAIWVKRNPTTEKTPFAMFSFHPTAAAKYVEDGLRTSARLLGVAMYIRMDKFDSHEFRKQIDSLFPERDLATELTHKK